MTGIVLEPPATYVHEFKGRLFVHEMLASKVDVACRVYGMTTPFEIDACALRLGEGACIVVLPIIGVGGVGARTYGALRRHEIAHCNGWRH